MKRVHYEVREIQQMVAHGRGWVVVARLHSRRAAIALARDLNGEVRKVTTEDVPLRRGLR